MEENKLLVYDYLTLFSVLSVSISIGLYQALKAKCKCFKLFNSFGSKKILDDYSESNGEIREYLVANRSLSALPIALSLVASFFSATAILGFPAEGKPIT